MTPRLRWGVLLLVAAFAAAGARPAPQPAPGDDYVFPVWPGLRPEQQHAIEKAWRQVLAGKTGPAERGFRKLPRQRPNLVPAETGLGYAQLRGNRLPAAAAAFDAVLAREPE